MHLVPIGPNLLLRVVPLYGWTGAHGSAEAVGPTEGLLDIVADELDQAPHIPTLLIGDLNGEPEDFPTLGVLLQTKGWTDLGAAHHRWGQLPEQPTCLAPGAARAARRDCFRVPPCQCAGQGLPRRVV